MGYLSDADVRGYGSSDKSACAAHIHDDSLLERLKGKFTDDECSFCGAIDVGVAVSVNDLLLIGMEKVSEEFSPAEDYGAGLAEMGLDYLSDHDTGAVLAGIFEGTVDDEVIEEVSLCGGDQMWVPESVMHFDTQQVLTGTWSDFVKKVKHSRRFWFSDDSHHDPEKLSVPDFFQSVAKLLTRSDVAITLPAGSTLIRGRMVKGDADETTFDAKELGSPPETVAAANRMSPAGVSMFYGGDSAAVVIAEIGAHSTYDHAVFGTFVTLEDLTIVDLTNLPPIPGYFTADPDRLQIAFLHDFVADLAKPVVLDGREHIDYVPTQIVTEYLRYFADPEVHGLRFASSQLLGGGLNTVVFCGRHRCVNPPGSDMDQDGWPSPEATAEVKLRFPGAMPWLQLDPSSVTKVKTFTAPAPRL